MLHSTYDGLAQAAPLLDWCRQQRDFLGPIQSRQFILIGAQHILGTTASLLVTLSHAGLRPENVYVLGKYYSTNFQTLSRLRRRGFNVEGGAVPPAGKPFREAFATQVETIWGKVLRFTEDRKKIPIVVLDDGGTFLERAPWTRLDNRQVVGVEQTTMGIERLLRKEMRVPVVDVARSWAKTYWESPSVGEVVVKAVEKALEKPLDSYRFGVVGMGNVGRAVASSLIKRKCGVWGFDVATDKEMSMDVVKVKSLPEMAKEVDVIVGCTGKDIFESYGHELPWKGKKVLASASSEDVEFLTLLRNFTEDDIRLEGHSTVGKSLRHSNAEAEILRGGYPINFDGGVHSIPPSEIQLTRGLLLLGVAQVLESLQGSGREPGVVALDLDRQEKLVDQWKRIRQVV